VKTIWKEGFSHFQSYKPFSESSYPFTFTFSFLRSKKSLTYKGFLEKKVYRFTPCGTLRKSNFSQALPGFLCPKLQRGLLRLYAFSVYLARWNLMVARPTSSS